MNSPLKVALLALKNKKRGTTIQLNKSRYEKRGGKGGVGGGAAGRRKQSITLLN